MFVTGRAVWVADCGKYINFAALQVRRRGFALLRGQSVWERGQVCACVRRKYIPESAPVGKRSRFQGKISSPYGKHIKFSSEPLWETHQLQNPMGKRSTFAKPHTSADGQRLIHYAEQQPAVVLSAIADP